MSPTTTKKVPKPNAHPSRTTNTRKAKETPQIALINEEGVASQEEEYVDKSEPEDEDYDVATKSNKRKRKTPAKPTTISNKTTSRSRKKTKKNVVKYKGLLGPFSEMPFDVLLEIFGWLGPPALLSLGRTSGSLRELLKSTDLELTWRKAISQAGLPECPTSMCHPAFAELAYGKGCLSCGKTNGNIYHIWEATMRLCTQCIPTKGYTSSTPNTTHSFLKRYIPLVYIRGRCYYSREHVSKWLAEYVSIRHSGVNVRSTWETKKAQELEQIKQFADKCQSWHDLSVKQSAHEHEEEVNQRKERVVEMVKELGWEHELLQTPANLLPHNNSDIAKICQNRLTDHAINTLKKKLPIIMQELKTQRLSQEYEAVRRARMVQLETEYEKALSAYWPAEKYRPHVTDILCISHIRKLVDLPTDNGDVQFEFGKSPKALTELIEGVRLAIGQKIASLLPVSAQPKRKITGISNVCASTLATTLLFSLDYPTCRTGENFYTVAQALESTKARRYVGDLKKARDSSSDFDPVAYDVLKCGHWDVNKEIKLNKKAHTTASSILKDVFGLDPLTTTTETMDELNPIVECLQCNCMRSGKMMMSWTALIKHHLGTLQHSTPSNTSRSFSNYRLLTDETELKEVRLRMRESIMRHRYSEKSKAVCTHCGRIDSIDKLRGHLNLKHNIAFPEDKDMKFVYDRNFPKDVRLPCYRDHDGMQGNVHWMWPPRSPLGYIEEGDTNTV